MRGRKPKPTALKLVEGNPGKRPLNHSEPRPNSGSPAPPPYLSEAARETWDRIADMLEAMGIATTADSLALGQLCEAVADYESAAAEIAKRGAYYSTAMESGSTMYRAHPALAAKADGDRRIRGWVAEFGLSPSARSRVTALVDEEDPDDALFNW
jgi:P27 family predicted phage terminase small subunit